MKQALERILKYYGSEVKLVSSTGTQVVQAFLRPVTTKGLQALHHSIGDFGQIPGGQYVYIGPVAGVMDGVEVILCGGIRYELRQTELLCLGEKPCYVWALLTRGGDEDGGTD